MFDVRINLQMFDVRRSRFVLPMRGVRIVRINLTM